MTHFEYVSSGRECAKKGEIDKAIADYNEGIRLDPNNALAYTWRIEVYKRKGNCELEMIKDYSELIRIDPNYASPYYQRAYLYEKKGGYDKAIADYSEAIRCGYQHLYSSRGKLYMEKGNYDKAIADFEAKLKIEPDNDVAKEMLEEAISKKNKK